MQEALQERGETGPDEVRALRQAFAHFTRQTEQLRQAYLALKVTTKAVADTLLPGYDCAVTELQMPATQPERYRR